MARRHAGWAAILVALLALGLAASQAGCRGPASTLPSRLTDQQFWQLSSDLSEPAGYFRSENLVSNEHTFQYVIPDLIQRLGPGGVYLGVAPDQNFTYIVATAPQLAFILDIRRGNLLQHLMYKALIELSADRAEFVSRLFAKPRPLGLTLQDSVSDLFAAFDQVATDEMLYRQNVKAIVDVLVRRHGFALTTDDLSQIESIYFAFFWDGPSLRYSTSAGAGGAGRGVGFPTYEELMKQTDTRGVARSYLASERNFLILKEMEANNLIVPVVGNFAGPKALRAMGRYIREHGATVSAFYVSNVEQYLYQDGIFSDFARNVATLPVNRTSTFIRSVSSRYGYTGGGLGPDGRATALHPIQSFLSDFQRNRLWTYFDLNARSR